MTGQRGEASRFWICLPSSIVCNRSRGGRMMHARIVGVAAGALLLSSAAGLAAPKLAPKEIQHTFFPGQASTSSTPSHIKLRLVFTPDGKIPRNPAGLAARL